ncbi:hypothetical protein [Tissierella creatinophila]|uniref:Uncharacterized protein n=1 Tax=Tissierella creatinophila DSM 6911 TaxID=1123403 RepID=A0A1U7M7N3_TISCR|nr:hypothetical protein [Tissierella creatinophila]OLS03208.1 hypothetical protein TICRE_09090 [Tissierella creatinophila DSM 6911]
MEKIKVTIFYPGGFHLKRKELELTQIELLAMLMSNKVLSEEKCFEIESKIFYDVGDGTIEARVVLGDCY